MSVKLSIAGETHMAMRVWRHFQHLREQHHQFDLCLRVTNCLPFSEPQCFFRVLMAANSTHTVYSLRHVCQLYNRKEFLLLPCPMREAFVQLSWIRRPHRKLFFFTQNNPFHRVLDSLLDFAYTGKVKVNPETLAPLAVLAQRVGLCELVDVCANAIIKRCVSFLCRRVPKI